MDVIKDQFQREVETNSKITQRLWDELPQEMKEVLADVVFKTQIVQKLDDGYGKVILTIQRGKVFDIKMITEKIVKPLKVEMV